MKSILLALFSLSVAAPAGAETWQCTAAGGHTYTSSQSVPADRCKIVVAASNPFEAGSGATPIAAATGIQRCIGMKPDSKRLVCFDAEVKLAPAQALVDAPAPRAASHSGDTCHTGPRGGRYRMVNGHKRYGC